MKRSKRISLPTIRLFGRMMRRTSAMIILILCIPLIVCICGLVKLTSRGPILHAQMRVGRHMKPFRLYKFRSMRVESGDTIRLTMPEDRRITNIGRLLRRHRLDEIPQLWNIVRGEMGWFGPRPEQAYYVERIVARSQSFQSLYRALPGLISLGVVQCGYTEHVDEMIRRAKYDKYYLQHPSWGLNVYLLFRAIGIVIKGKGR